MRMFARLYKIDEARREVWGRLAEEVPDNSREVFDYATSKPYFEEWSAEFQKNTGGKSFGNLRAMHNLVAAGKLIAMVCNDQEKAIDIGTKVVDDNEWAKVEEGVYTGFSVGGKYLKKWSDGHNTRYTGKPNEVSLVDKPCIPTATFYEVIKMDGSVTKKEFKAPAMSSEQAVDELAKMLNSGKISPVELVGLAKAHSDEEDGDEEDSGDDLERPDDVPEDEWDDMSREEKEECLEEHGKAAKNDDSDGKDAKDDAKDGDDDDEEEDKKEGKDGDGADDNDGEDEPPAKKADVAAHNARIEKRAKELAKAEFAKLPEKDRAAMKGLDEANWQNFVTQAVRELKKIAERSDADPKEGESKYGDVKFADEKNKKYPIDTEGHIRAAWNYINKPKNAAKYSSEDTASIKAKIVAAWKAKIDKEGPPSAAEKADGAKPDQEEKCNMADAKGDLKKGLNNVQNFAQALYGCASILMSAQNDAMVEGDNSPVPDQLRGWIADGAEIFKGMAAEEADELVEACHSGAAGAYMNLVDPTGELRKALETKEGMSKAIADYLSTAEILALALSTKPTELNKALHDAVLRKAGARHSKEDMGHLQEAHDRLVKLGAMCKADSMSDYQQGPEEMNADKGNKHVDTTVIDKAEGSGNLLKALTKVDALTEALAKAEARLKKLEDMPAPTKGVLRVVDKDGNEEVKKAAPAPIPGQHNPKAAEEMIKAAVTATAPFRRY